VIKTNVYIDGFNLYYGSLKRSAYKWLNIQSTFEALLAKRNRIDTIKYFTARVRPTPNDPEIQQHQDAYLRAISNYCPKVKIIYGHYSRHKVPMETVTPPPPTVMVWKNEEKGSDVNLAVHILDDAWRNDFDCAVVVSNDSDLAEALRMVKALNKRVGLVTPGAPKRSTSRELAKYADFIKSLRAHSLSSHQLPDPVPGTSIYKPADW
jgi:uncharacterized LabA/DUF88 family protein